MQSLVWANKLSTCQKIIRNRTKTAHNHASLRMRDQKYYHRICYLNQFNRNTSNTKA